MTSTDYVIPLHSMEQTLEQLLTEIKQVVTHTVPRHLQVVLPKGDFFRTVSFNIMTPLQYPDELLGPPGTVSGEWTTISREEWESQLTAITWGGFSKEICTRLISETQSYFPDSDTLSFVDVGNDGGVLMITSGIMLLVLIEDETPFQ